MDKIPCVIMIYHDFKIIKKTIDGLLKYSHLLDLIVVENQSEFTVKLIKPYILDLINRRAVSKYFLFKKNITNNALEVILDSGLIDLEGSDYFILTDGDLYVENEDWLSEQLEILRTCHDVSACAISLDISNLPVKTFPEAEGWIPDAISETELYIEAATGLHLVLFRTVDLIKFLNYRKKYNLRFVDSNLREHCYMSLHKKWVRTKKSRAVHLTWDLYSDPNHSYTKSKKTKSFAQIWHHHFYSAFEFYTRNSVSMHLPLGKIVRGQIHEYKKPLREYAGRFRSALFNTIKEPTK